MGLEGVYQPMFELPMQPLIRRSLLTRKCKAEFMSEVPAMNKDLLLQPANQTSDEAEEEGVPMSRGAHIGIGLLASAFGGMFGGIPLGMFIGLFLDGWSLIELVPLGLFVSPFVLIGGSMFIFGVVCVGAGIIGYPLIKEYDDEDEEEGDGGPVSTAFAYTSEDEMLEQIRETQVQPALAEPGEKAPTLGWGMAPGNQPSGDEGTLQEGKADSFWEQMRTPEEV
jgi:hypothetical protein